MAEKKIFAGDRLRRLRTSQAVRQGELARRIGISASYLNQIESDQRPITAAILQRLVGALGVNESYFVDTEDARRAANLREALGDPVFKLHGVAAEEVQAMVRVAPQFSDALLALYRAYTERETMAPALVSRFPYDEVRDWVQARGNYFDTLDRAAEALAATAGFGQAGLLANLTRYLRHTHGIDVQSDAALLGQGMFWRREAGQLLLAQGATPASQAFWLAHVIGQLEAAALLEREIRRAQLSGGEARALARTMLANYFAGALLLPYREFHAQAELAGYDLQRLQSRFGASFEQICHRLSTLQRPELPGIAFYFLKTDIAGNILKRSSATRFQFAQFGGACPLWNVFRAFAQPGEILVQLADTPDQQAYLNIARTVGQGAASYRSRPRAVAVMLGCDRRDAARTVYAAGLNLADPAVADPVGPGCRACERTTCRHRSAPPMGREFDAGGPARGVVPYQMRLDQLDYSA